MSKMKKRTILAIGAHFDDIELGCGGTLAKHVQSGDEVYGLIMTDSQYFNRSGEVVRNGGLALEEAIEAAKIIGYKLITETGIENCHLDFNDFVNSKLIKHIEEISPDIVYTHWTGDAHHDHRNLAWSTLNACKHIDRVLMYRSNWYDSDIAFRDCFYSDISETWGKKECSIRAYKTEMSRNGEEWIKYFKNLAENNGLKCGVKYAESFEPVKWFF